MAACAIFLLPLFAVILEFSVSSGCSEKDRLVKDLTKGYLTSVEPESTTIKVGLALQCARYDRSTGELSTKAWERYYWTDTRLRWEPKDYDGIDVLRLPSTAIWTPDFKLYNSIKAVDERDKTNTVVTHRGEVIWIPTVNYKTLCSNEPTGNGLNCDLIRGPWTYDANLFKLELDGHGFDTTSYLNGTCPLTVQRGSAIIRTRYYPCCKEPYGTLDINLRLRPST